MLSFAADERGKYFMVLKVLHAGISVYNMEESLAWYDKNLDFKLVADDGFVPPLKARICFIQNGDFQIELFEYEHPKKLPEDRLTPNSDLQTVGTKAHRVCHRELWPPSKKNLSKTA